MITYEGIKKELEVIRDEINEGRNTAIRVGSALLNILNFSNQNEIIENEHYTALKVMLDKISLTVGQLELGDKDATMFVRKSEMLVELDKISASVYEKVKNDMGETDYVTQSSLELYSDGIKAAVLRQAVNDASEYVLGEIALRNYAAQSSLNMTEHNILMAVEAQGKTIKDEVEQNYASKSELEMTAQGLVSTVREAVTNDLGGFVTQSQFTQTATQIQASVTQSVLRQVDENGYITTTEASSLITQTANQIQLAVQESVLREVEEGGYITETKANSLITQTARDIKAEVKEDVTTQVTQEVDGKTKDFITVERAQSMLDLSANSLILTFDKNLEQKVSDAVDGAVDEAFESVEYVTKNEFEISNNGLTETITTAETTVKNALVHIQTTESSLKDTKDEFSKTIKDVETIKDTVEDIETTIESNSYLKLTKTEFETNIANKVMEKKGGEFVSSTTYNSFISQLPNEISMKVKGEYENADGTANSKFANLMMGVVTDENGNLKSSISVSADQINLDGNVSISGTFTAVNTSTGVSITPSDINYEKRDVYGEKSGANFSSDGLALYRDWKHSSLIANALGVTISGDYEGATFDAHVEKDRIYFTTEMNYSAPVEGTSISYNSIRSGEIYAKSIFITKEDGSIHDLANKADQSYVESLEKRIAALEAKLNAQ